MSRRLAVGMLVGAGLVAATGVLVALGDRSGQTKVSRFGVLSRILHADSVITVPSAAQAVTIEVTPTVTLDANTGLYTYSYAVHNSASSTNAVTNFALAPVPRPLTMSTPAHWAVNRWAYGATDSAIVWWVSDVGTLPLGYVDTGNIAPSEFNIAPGATLSGFSFVTQIPPIPNGASFFAQGFDTLPNSEEAPSDEDPQPTLFESGVTGTIDGPGSGVGVEPGGSSAGVKLGASPNPNRGTAQITFYLAEPSDVTVRINDVAGREVKTLLRMRLEPGTRTVHWDGRDKAGAVLKPGVYMCQLVVDGQVMGRQKVVVTR